MLMHNPPHPGEVIRGLYLEPLGVSVTAAAKAPWRQQEASLPADEWSYGH
jgi:plasmid maintenance system antidote protein VapI